MITQGAGGYSEWTTSYRVLTSLDCVTFVPALDENGNEASILRMCYFGWKIEIYFIECILDTITPIMFTYVKFQS